MSDIRMMDEEEVRMLLSSCRFRQIDNLIREITTEEDGIMVVDLRGVIYKITYTGESYITKELKKSREKNWYCIIV